MKEGGRLAQGPGTVPLAGAARSLWDVYRAEFRTSVAVQMQYRAAQLIWLLGTVLGPVVYLAVWSAVAAASGGTVGGYDRHTFAAYYLTLMLVNQVTFTWIMYEFQGRIREGSFTPLILRPVHPIHGDVADNLAHKALTLAVLLPTAAALAVAFRPAFRGLPPLDALLLLPSLVLAFVLRFAVEWTLALAAFWTVRTSALNGLYEGVLLFLSGQVAPLPLLPQPLRALADVLPFRFMVAFPVSLAVGRPLPAAAVLGLSAQALWAAAAVAALLVVWRAAVRRYAAVGG